MPTIGVRFDIDKAGGGYYGLTCWKIFWQAITPEEIGVASLYEGDTAATLNGQERVFCIVVQSLNASVIGKVKTALNRTESFKGVCAAPMFVEGSSCAAEPLPDAGRIDAEGNLVGNVGSSRSALDAVRNEITTATQAAEEVLVSEMAKPASQPGASVHCDICHKLGKWETLKAKKMRNAVRKGFDPFKEGIAIEATGFAKLFGVDRNLPKAWKESVIDGRLSLTDWNVCDQCMRKIRPYLTDLPSILLYTVVGLMGILFILAEILLVIHGGIGRAAAQLFISVAISLVIMVILGSIFHSESSRDSTDKFTRYAQAIVGFAMIIIPILVYLITYRMSWLAASKGQALEQQKGIEHKISGTSAEGQEKQRSSD